MSQLQCHKGHSKFGGGFAGGIRANYVSEAGLELAIYPRLTSNSRSCCLSLLSAWCWDYKWVLPELAENGIFKVKAQWVLLLISFQVKHHKTILLEKLHIALADGGHSRAKNCRQPSKLTLISLQSDKSEVRGNNSTVTAPPHYAGQVRDATAPMSKLQTWTLGIFNIIISKTIFFSSSNAVIAL